MVGDPVNHPDHYAANKIGGLECIDVTRHFMFSPGNTIKYVWRAGYKIDDMQDLDKAEFYLNDAKISNTSDCVSSIPVAEYLGKLDNLDKREEIVVGVVTALADGMYNKASNYLTQLRNYLKESMNAREDRDQN